MRRKDILIISAVVIVIAFSAVFGMYYVLNDGNIFSSVKEKVDEVIASKKTHHSNGWETAIVDKIIDDVPIPVGFTYVEGKKNTGIIIENNTTQEKYMWIPKSEVEKASYEEAITTIYLDGTEEEAIENIEKYSGFYVAIADDNEEGINLDTINNMTEEEYTNLQIENYSETETVETHLISLEEMVLVNKFNEEIENKINLKNYKALTVLGARKGISVTSTKNLLADYKKRIEQAIEYIEKEKDITDDKIINTVNQNGDLYDQLINFDVFVAPDHYYQIQDLYTDITNILIEEFGLNNIQEEKVINILNEETEEEEEENKQETEEETSSIKIENWDANIIKSAVKEEINGKTHYAPIPKGFTYVEGTKLETGLKIKNGDNLSFIWIPAKDIIEELADKKMNEITDDRENTRYEIIAKEMQEGFIAAMESAIGDENTGGYENYIDNSKDAEYKELIDSIEKYGGFYISEAELGYDRFGNTINTYRAMENGYVSNGDYYRNVEESRHSTNNTIKGIQENFNLTYDEAVNKCKELYADSTVVTSHLTYGLEYDATVLYLLENCEDATSDKLFDDSTYIGKYQIDSSEEDGNQLKEYYQKLWETEYYLNGIYGLAGNLSEITQEKDSKNSTNVIIRGGDWSEYGYRMPLGSKTSGTIDALDLGEFKTAEGIEEIKGTIGFRACLYINTTYNEANENKTEQKELKIGDYINYNPTGESEYEIGSIYTGYSTGNQKIEAENLKWRVFNINDNGTVDLISSNNTSNYITLKGAEGYNNGVLILNGLCKNLYGNDKLGAVARSINIEDIKQKINYDYKEYKDADSGQKFGTEKTYTSLNIPKQLINESNGSIQNGWTEGTYEQKSDFKIKQTYLGNTVYENNNKKNANVKINNSYVQAYKDGYYELLKSDEAYWLASRYENLKNNVVDFGLYKMKNANIDNSLLFQGAKSGSLSLHIRPIVTISKDAINLQEAYSNKTGWETKNPEESDKTETEVKGNQTGTGEQQGVAIEGGRVWKEGYEWEGKTVAEVANEFLTIFPPAAIENDWKYYDEVWKQEYEKWKTEEVNGTKDENGNVITKGIKDEETLEEAKRRATVAIANINKWIQSRIDVTAIADEFLGTDPDTWDYSGVWKEEYDKWKQDGKEMIIRDATSAEDARTKATAEMADINRWINEKVVAEKAAIAAIADEFWETDPDTWDYSGVWKEEYDKWKQDGKEMIIRDATSAEDARTKATAEMADINRWINEKVVAEKAAIAAIADEFFGTNPDTWDYSGVWEEEYVKWKQNGKEMIIRDATSAEDARTKATAEMADINRWINEKIAAEKAAATPPASDGGDTDLSKDLIEKLEEKYGKTKVKYTDRDKKITVQIGTSRNGTKYEFIYSPERKVYIETAESMKKRSEKNWWDSSEEAYFFLEGFSRLPYWKDAEYIDKTPELEGETDKEWIIMTNGDESELYSYLKKGSHVWEYRYGKNGKKGSAQWNCEITYIDTRRWEGTKEEKLPYRIVLRLDKANKDFLNLWVE